MTDSRERPQRSGDRAGVTHPVSSRHPRGDFPVAAGKVVTIPNGTRGPVMTVTYEPPRLNRIGSPHALTLTPQKGPSADIGSSQAACGNRICDNL